MVIIAKSIFLNFFKYFLDEELIDVISTWNVIMFNICLIRKNNFIVGRKIYIFNRLGRIFRDRFRVIEMKWAKIEFLIKTLVQLMISEEEGGLGSIRPKAWGAYFIKKGKARFIEILCTWFSYNCLQYLKHLSVLN